MKRAIKVLLITVAVIIAAIVILIGVAIWWSFAPDPEEFSGDSVYYNDRLWARIKSDGGESVGMVDTGASVSTLTKEHIASTTPSAEGSLGTIFERIPVSYYPSKEINVLGKNFTSLDVLESENGELSIGNEITLGRGPVLLSRDHGIEYATYDPDAFAECFQATLEYNTDNVVSKIYIDLTVDGSPETVFIDTGLFAFMRAAGPLKPEDRSGSPDGYDIRVGAQSQYKFVKYENRDIHYEIGGVTRKVNVKQFYDSRPSPASYVIGGDFIAEFDMYIDIDLERVCIRPNGSSAAR